MKKIIHIINGLDLGGTETALFRLLCITHTEHQIFVIALNNPGHYSKKIEALGIPVYHLIFRKNPLFACFRLYCYIKHIQPDIVQTWLYHADLFGGLSAKWCGVKKIIWGIRCEGVGLKPKTALIKQICARFSPSIPHHIITNSQKAAMNHIQSGYDPQKIQVIANGFDPNAFYLEKNAHKRPSNNTITIGTLARFHEDKGYFNLIQIIDIICDAQPNVYFVLCGEGCHTTNNTLNTRLKTLRHQNNVILINGVSDTKTYLNTLDIFILPSKTESFPNSLAEAMLCELPCIATDVGEVRQIGGEYIVLVPPEDPSQLASACLMMLQKTCQQRAQLGALARQRVEEHYSILTYKKHIEMIYSINN